MTNDDDDRGRLERRRGPNHALDQGQTVGLVEEFGDRGLHPGALTRSQDDHVKVRHNE